MTLPPVAVELTAVVFVTVVTPPNVEPSNTLKLVPVPSNTKKSNVPVLAVN